MSAPETAALSGQAAATVTAVARAMYPHDALPDEVYARVAEKLGEATESAAVVKFGVAGLTGFTEKSPVEQAQALREIEGSEFFELVRSTAIVEIYSDPRTWAAFGYEGPSFDKGGYINRGFNDLDWLPDPEGDAS
jgi:hypothetical protein